MVKSRVWKFAGLASLALTVGLAAHLGSAHAEGEDALVSMPSQSLKECVNSGRLLGRAQLQASMSDADRAFHELRHEIGVRFLPVIDDAVKAYTPPSMDRLVEMIERSTRSYHLNTDIPLEEDTSFLTEAKRIVGLEDDNFVRMNGKNYKADMDAIHKAPKQDAEGIKVTLSEEEEEGQKKLPYMLKLSLSRKDTAQEFFDRGVTWPLSFSKQFGKKVVSRATSYPELEEAAARQREIDDNNIEFYKNEMELFLNVQTDEGRAGEAALERRKEEEKKAKAFARVQKPRVVLGTMRKVAEKLVSLISGDQNVIDYTEYGPTRSELVRVRAQAVQFLDSIKPLERHYACQEIVDAHARAEAEMVRREEERKAKLEAAKKQAPASLRAPDDTKIEGWKEPSFPVPVEQESPFSANTPSPLLYTPGPTNR